MIPSCQNFRLTNKFIILSILLLGFSAYCFVLGSPFKTLDDYISIVHNEDIKNFRLKEIFTTSFFGGGHYYRPLVSLSFMIEHALFGLNPVYFNLTNVFIHLASACVVFFLINLLLTNRVIAFFTALLFVVHPIHWEAVCNISGRAILLSGFFVLSSFLCYMVFHQRKSITAYVGSLILFALGLLSKESAAMLPIVIGAYLILVDRNSCVIASPKGEAIFLEEGLLRRLWLLAMTRARKLLFILPYFVLIALYIFIRSHMGMTETYPWRNGAEFILGVASFLRGCLTYGRLLIFPSDLHFDRGQAMFVQFSDLEFIGTIAAYLGLLILLVKFYRRIPPIILFFSLWIAIELFPVSQIITTIGVQPGYISLAEHFFYVPSIGAFVLMSMAAMRVWTWNKSRQFVSPVILKSIGIGYLVMMLLVTMQQAIYARSPISMFDQTLSRNPHNARILYSQGFEYAAIRQFDRAEQYFRKSIDEDPLLALPRIGLAKSLCDQDRCLEGIAEYEKIIDPGQYADLIKENLRLSYEIVIQKYLDRMKEDSKNSKLYYSLGVMYAKTNRLDEAIAQFEMALQLNPADTDAIFNLASIYEVKGELGRAMSLYEQLVAQPAISFEMKQYVQTKLVELKKR